MPEYRDEATVTVDISCSTGDIAQFTDAATVYAVSTPSTVAEVFAGARDEGTCNIVMYVLGDETLNGQYEDVITVYLSMRNVGGECYSTFTGLQLDAEAYCRWNPGMTEDRWLETEDCRWQADDANVLHPLDGEGYLEWYPIENTVRWSADDELRWIVTDVIPMRIC